VLLGNIFEIYSPKFIRLIKDSTLSLVSQYLFSLQTDSQAPTFLFLFYLFFYLRRSMLPAIE